MKKQITIVYDDFWGEPESLLLRHEKHGIRYVNLLDQKLKPKTCPIKDETNK